VLAVVVVDQTTKWAAGHGAESIDFTVNSGVSRDLPRLLDGVVAGVPFGAALDLAGAVLLAVLLTVTIRRTRGLVRVGLREGGCRGMIRGASWLIASASRRSSSGSSRGIMLSSS
jgi:hypothetical protein